MYLDYLLLKAALSRLQSTVIATTIRNGKHWRRRQFSWINEWEEMTTHTGRVEGMEFVLPEWFYNSVIDRSLVLRSEEHTSELQSLMRISYAVFCLKKKKQQDIKADT